MKSRIKVLSLLLGLGFLLVFVGCDSQSENSATTDTEVSELEIQENEAAVEESEEPAFETAEDGTRIYTVTIKAMQFNPAELEIRAGDRVVWVNNGIVAHDVTESNVEFTSGQIEVDNSWEFEPESSFEYYCSIHPTMKGSVKVTE